MDSFFNRPFSYKRSILLAFLLSTSLILVYCREKNSGEADTVDYVSFDRSKLDIEITDLDLGISFSAPRSWSFKQTSISNKTESRGSAVNPSDNIIYKPTYVFFNDSTGSLLSVGKIITEDSSMAGPARINFYKSLLISKYKNDKIKVVNFINSRILLTQFKIERQNLVSFRIIFENARQEIIQFDYTVPLGRLESDYPSIKSSIGSLKLL